MASSPFTVQRLGARRFLVAATTLLGLAVGAYPLGWSAGLTVALGLAVVIALALLIELSGLLKLQQHLENKRVEQEAILAVNTQKLIEADAHLATARDELDQLRTRAADPSLTLEAVQQVVTGVAGVADRVLHDRGQATAGTTRHPVLRFTLTADGDVEMSTGPTGSANPVLVALFGPAGALPVRTELVPDTHGATGRATCLLDQLPEPLPSRLPLMGAESFSGFYLDLAGIADDTFAKVPDAEVLAVAEATGRARQALNQALQARSTP